MHLVVLIGMARGGKKASRTNYIYYTIGALLLVAIAYFAFNSGSINPSGPAMISNATVTPNAALGDYPPELYARLRAYQQSPEAVSKRPAYFGAITDEVFKELPSFPKDFYVIKLLYELGKVTDGSKITEEYYKQPEFYPQFEEQGVPLMLNPPQNRWGAFGYGTYPSEMVVLSPRTNKLKVRFFIHTSWLVQTYQGMSFGYEFPAKAQLQKTAFADNSKDVIQDPAETRKYFDVSISPDVTLLEPAFPVFKPGWAQAVTMDITVKNPPTGKYAIGVIIANPPSEKANEWLWKYKTNYVGGSAHSIGVPWFTAFIQV
ncbi:MAG: hypothetical protein ABIG96_00685 [Candidatus Micrarchaeota archaeon]